MLQSAAYEVLEHSFSTVSQLLDARWVSRSGRAVFRHGHCWNCQRCIRAKQTYHQDQHPECTLHGFVLLHAGPLGAETLVWLELYGACQDL
jgi:hypothetical protein